MPSIPRPSRSEQVHARPDQVQAILGVLARLEPSTVITVQPDPPHHVLVGVRELPPDPRCAGAGLFCLDTPGPSSLVGVSFTGDTGHPDADGPVRVDALVTSSGEVHSQIHHDGREPAAVTGAAGGVVVDALHRMLGLPAPGEAPPLIAMVAGVWFHQILHLMGSGHVPTWADVASAHLGPAHGAPSGFDRPPPSEEVVAASMQELADEADWDHLRRAAAIGRMAAPELDPEEAGWMDDTMFARWMVDSFPSADVVLSRLDAAGSGDVARRIGNVLRRLGRG